MSQLSFASMTPKHKNTLRQDQFLNEMKKIVPWMKIAKLIRPLYFNNKTGRPPYDLVLMIKIHCLQQWYNLGDLSMEEAIYDRRSFVKFLDLDLMLDRIPDETTIMDSGLIHSCVITPAKAADVDHRMDLLHWEEQVILGDKGYVSKENKKWARQEGIFWGVLDRGSSKKGLSRSQEKRNRKLSSVRAKVEHSFRIIKDLWRHRKTRYKGLVKNRGQMLVLCGLANLYRVRKVLLCGT